VEAEIYGILSSHVWEPVADPGGRLTARAADAAAGVQDKSFAQATALVKLPRDRQSNPITPAVLAHEKLASDLGRKLAVSVNEVFLLRELGPSWGGRSGSWASLHCLVPEPFQRLDEFPERDAVWSGQDRAFLENDDEFRSLPLFDALILNTDRHAGNVLVSGGRVLGKRWIYFIDHGYAFGGDVRPDQLADETQGKKLRKYVEARSTMQAVWDSATDEQKTHFAPLAERIASLSDEDIAALVRFLPDDLAPKATKRFLMRLLQHHVMIIRDEIT
jgi:hypothetical protein